VPKPADQLSAILADKAFTPVAMAARMLNYKSLSADQVLAVRLVELLYDRVAAGNREPVALRELLKDTDLPKSSAFRLLVLQPAELWPLLRAVAVGSIQAWSAVAVAQLRPKNWEAALDAADPDAELVAALDRHDADWRNVIRYSSGRPTKKTPAKRKK
jgi:hypothetical protein